MGGGGRALTACYRLRMRIALTVTGLALSGVALARAPVPSQVEQAARGNITRADQVTRLYLQRRLEGMGYRGAFANGGWRQPLDVVGIRSQLPGKWSFQGKNGRVDLAWKPGDEFEPARKHALAAVGGN